MSGSKRSITWQPGKYELDSDNPEVLKKVGLSNDRDIRYISGFTDTPEYGGWWVTAELRLGEHGLAVTGLVIAPHPAILEGTGIRRRTSHEIAALSIDTNLMRVLQPAEIKRAFWLLQEAMAVTLSVDHPMRLQFERARDTSDRQTGRGPSVMTPENLLLFADQLLAESRQPGFRERLAEAWGVSTETAKYRISELKKRHYVQGSGASMTAGPAIPRKEQHGAN